MSTCTSLARGLRASELIALRCDQVDFRRAVLHVRRVKGGTPSVHPLTGMELRALRRLQRESAASPLVFVSERGIPFTAAGFARMMTGGHGCRWLKGPSAPDMPVGTRWRTQDATPVRCKPWAQQHSAHVPYTDWRRTGSAISGRTNSGNDIAGRSRVAILIARRRAV